MIPCYWVSYAGPVRCRWDEQMLDRIISGFGKRPGRFPKVFHYETLAAFQTPTYLESCIVMFPAGDHDETHVDQFNADLAKHRNPVVFFTSDEGSLFPVYKIVHPEMTAFVMTPRTDREYPEGAFFIGEGDADAGSVHDVDPTVDKSTDLFFLGQGRHPRRLEMRAALDEWVACQPPPDVPVVSGRHYTWDVGTTPGFLQGVPRERYLELMAQSKVALCPAGTKTQDSFRVYEALTYGCVPVLDAVRNDGESPHYWERLGGDLEVCVPIVKDWAADLDSAIGYALNDWPKSAVRAHEWWHWHRRRLALHLAESLTDSSPVPVSEQITVMVTTSPIPSHPSTAIIESTINSVRHFLDSEILVMVDGVRPEQADREGDYWEYVRRLMLVAERDGNITPVVSWLHVHQAELMRRALEHVTTPYVLFVEHDCPFDGQPIDFEGVLTAMDYYSLNLMRFFHESHVPEGHAHLFLETEPPERHLNIPFIRTMQWSQRPHVARTDFYRALMSQFFAPGARTMLEEVLHGIAEFAYCKQDESLWSGWDYWRMAVYAPSEGGMRRTLHLDGRDTDPKYEMTFQYPGERPYGAPRPGTR